MRLLTCLVLATALAAGCRTARNYTAPEGPRYAGRTPWTAHTARRPDSLRIATFNIEFGVRVDSALVVLTTEPALRNLDILLLQEMDEHGTRRIAAALGMDYVYYPATFRFNTGRDFGNAVLSRWPITQDRKIVLPHLGRVGHTLRTTTGATVMVADVPVRVYSTHLGTIANVSRAGRVDQLRVMLADAATYPRVILGGDLNDPSIGRVARQAGYAWPTRHGPRTTWGGRLDHILLRGFTAGDSAVSGTIAQNHHASDHLPVWVVLPFR